MPTYATRGDLESFFSQANVNDWADKDRDGQLDAAEQLAVDAALEAAESVVDSHLVKAGYSAPFEGDRYAALPPRPKSLLKQWTVTVAGFHIYAWRGLRDHANVLERLYDRTVADLRDLSAGAVLAGLARRTRIASGCGSTPGAPTDSLGALRSDGWDW